MISPQDDSHVFTEYEGQKLTVLAVLTVFGEVARYGVILLPWTVEH